MENLNLRQDIQDGIIPLPSQLLAALGLQGRFGLLRFEAHRDGHSFTQSLEILLNPVYSRSI